MSYSSLLYKYLYVKNLFTIAKDEEGQGMVEYAIIVVAIAAVALTAVAALGDQITSFMSSIDFGSIEAAQ